MAHEEEIEILQAAFAILDRTVKWYHHGIGHNFKIGENDIKALEVAKIAIEAMQTQLKESPENFNKDSAPESMLNADLISRQSVLDILNRSAWKTPEELEVFELVKKLPSVNPMQSSDAISRQMALEEIRNLKISVAGKDIFPNEAKETIIKTLDELPSVQPKQRTGKWITLKDEYGDVVEAVCSNCGRNGRHDWKYCPDCGEMKEVSK